MQNFDQQLREDHDLGQASDLEEKIHGDLLAADSEVEFSLETKAKARPLIWYEVESFAARIADKLAGLYSGTKHVMKRVGRVVLYPLAGGLPSRLQVRLESKLGSDTYNATTATLSNALITDSLLYGGAIYGISESSLSSEMKLGIGSILFALWFGGVLGRSLVADEYDKPTGSLAFSVPVYGFLAGKRAVRWVGDQYRDLTSGLRDEALERQQRVISGKYGA